MRSLKKNLMVIVLTLASGLAYSTTPYKPVITFMVVKVSYDPTMPEEEDHGQRMPGRKQNCTVDPVSGVQFVGMEKPDILSFEVYDLSGACVAVFGDEAAFLEYLFAQSGEYQIRLITVDWAYVGYIGL